MLKVNEIYGPVVQGEGKSTGMRCSFLRLALCNLHCIWCDTPYTWNWCDKNFSHSEKYDYDAEVHSMSTDDVLNQLRAIGVKWVVISGGEPFLQQKGLFDVVETLYKEGFWIEVETNGTIAPLPRFLDSIHQINCSPKLKNSGDPQKLRERPKALTTLAASKKSNFKFVIASANDALEAMTLVHKYSMKDVYFMPKGRTREELQQLQELVKRLAYSWGVSFTGRLHIMEFGDKRGV